MIGFGGKITHYSRLEEESSATFVPNRNFRLLLIAGVARWNGRVETATATATGQGVLPTTSGNVADGSHIVWCERHPTSAPVEMATKSIAACVDAVYQRWIAESAKNKEGLTVHRTAARNTLASFGGDGDEGWREARKNRTAIKHFEASGAEDWAGPTITLLLRHLVDAHESVERHCDGLQKAARGVDARVECLPLAMLMLRRYLLPLVEEVSIDTDLLEDMADREYAEQRGHTSPHHGKKKLAFNVRNCDVVTYMKLATLGRIKVTHEQERMIADIRECCKVICQTAYGDCIASRERVGRVVEGEGDEKELDVVCKIFADCFVTSLDKGDGTLVL